MTVAENIRKFRKEKKMTQRQLGEKCGMYESQIRKYELGAANPKIDTIKKIADVLNVSIDRLTGDSVSSIIESRLKEIGKTLETVSKEANVPLTWLQNIDSFVPGDMEFMLTQPRELDWDDTIGEYTSYEWITRVADVLGIPGSTLRTALARQEIPIPDGSPQITAEETFGGANTYSPQGIGEPEPLSIAEKDHISKYRDLDPHGKEMVDFTLQKEWERSTAVQEPGSKVVPMAVKEDAPDYLTVQAAHNDAETTDEELEKMERDSALIVEMLKNKRK